MCGGSGNDRGKLRFCPSGSRYTGSLLAGGRKECSVGGCFSEAETVPDAADPNGEYRQFGSSVLELKEGTAGMKQGNAILELAGEKATLRNGETDLKSILRSLQLL